MTENKNNKKPDDDFQWNKIGKHVLIAIFAFIFFIWFTESTFGDRDIYHLKAYNKLIEYVDKGIVKDLKFYESMDGKPAYFRGEFDPPINIEDPRTGKAKRYQYFEVNWPSNYQDEFNAISQKVQIEVLNRETDMFDVLINLLPWIFLIGIFFLLTKRMQSGVGGRGSGGWYFLNWEDTCNHAK